MDARGCRFDIPYTSAGGLGKEKRPSARGTVHSESAREELGPSDWHISRLPPLLEQVAHGPRPTVRFMCKIQRTPSVLRKGGIEEPTWICICLVANVTMPSWADGDL